MTEKINEAQQLAEIGYTTRAIELYQNKVNVGTIDNSDVSSVFLGNSGDLIRLYLKLTGEMVEDAKFLCYGCPGTLSAMSALTILVKGKPLIHAKRLSEDDVLEALGGLPPQSKNALNSP